MSEFLTSPLAWAAAWFACGACKIAIDLVRKSLVDFFTICHSIVFGPISLATELLEIFVAKSVESANAKEANEEAVDTAIEATRKLGESIEAAAESIESLEEAEKSKQRAESLSR